MDNGRENAQEILEKADEGRAGPWPLYQEAVVHKGKLTCLLNGVLELKKHTEGRAVRTVIRRMQFCNSYLTQKIGRPINC